MLKQTWLSIIKYLVLLGIIVWIWRTIRTDSKEYFKNVNEKFEDTPQIEVKEGKCGKDDSCTTCSDGFSEDGVKLLPVMDPLFNLREICKQSILVEEHLNNPEKSCINCIFKHFLSIEALAEEAISLDNESKYGFIRDLPTKYRSIQKEYSNGVDKCTIAQKFRKLRKDLMPICQDRC